MFSHNCRSWNCDLSHNLNRYLHFEGADMPSSGRYATSIPLSHAMDPTNDVMLAFGMNGRVLHPDHGYVRFATEWM